MELCISVVYDILLKSLGGRSVLVSTDQVTFAISDTMKLVTLGKSDRTDQVRLVSSASFPLLCSDSCEI